MALATLADVKRVLRMTGTANDGALSGFLDSADSWVKQTTRRTFDNSESQTVEFYNVREDTILALPDDCPIAPEGRTGCCRKGP